MDLFKHLYSIFLDESGDEDESTDANAGQEEAPEEGQGETPSGEEAQPEESTPGKYGRFGDEPNVDEMFQALQEVEQKHDGLTKKTGQTEKNLANLRRAAESPRTN